MCNENGELQVGEQRVLIVTLVPEEHQEPAERSALSTERGGRPAPGSTGSSVKPGTCRWSVQTSRKGIQTKKDATFI